MTLVIAIGLMSVMVIGGCDESFNPKTPFAELYVLQCFLDTEFKVPMTRIVLLSHSYDVEGLDPTINRHDPSVTGAEILLNVAGKVYRFRDSVRSLPTPSRYDTLQCFYYARGVVIEPMNNVSVTARLPNGRVLTAGTTAPMSRALKWSLEFPNGLHTSRNIPYGVDEVTVDWEDYEESEGHLFFPRLLIMYSKMEGGIEIAGSREVPLQYTQSNGSWNPVYPIETTRKSCTFDLSAIDSAMAGIAGADPNKGAYAISMMTFTMKEFDTPLSKYYSSIGGSMDQFSVRADRSVYSNVNGGVGIFGSAYTNRIEVPIDPLYVKSFGYRYR